MSHDIIDATADTTGIAYEGTTHFLAQGQEYGRQTWRFRAQDRGAAATTLRRLSEDSRFDDPRVDHIRRFSIRKARISA